MIEFIRIQNFKSLRDASFDLAGLNLFTGLNGMGKSTLIQSLLLLRQSAERNTLVTKGLLLNGDYVQTGLGFDVFSVDASPEEKLEFSIRWKNENRHFTFSFSYAPDSDLQPISDNSVDTCGNTVDFVNNGDYQPFSNQFSYLSADRIPPKTNYPISDYHVNELRSLGIHGEYTACFIASTGLQKLKSDYLVHPKAVANTILANIEAWMSEISPGLKIRAQSLPMLNAATLSYAFIQGKEVTADFKPQNVGFGLTYVLPVVTSLLAASPGDLLIIENPESHLHPAGQSVIGRLCALAAEAGVQLIIESHSDHFLNGVRVAVKEKLVSPDNIQLYFLERDGEKQEHQTVITNPKIDENGRLDCWPKNFFDEWDKVGETQADKERLQQVGSNRPFYFCSRYAPQ